MILTRESRRTWWLVMLGAWSLAATAALLHALAFRDYTALLDQAAARTPPISTPMRHIVPTNYADAQTWVRYALTFDEGAPWRVRYTYNDNAPMGREVHWNSAFAHLVAGAGRLRGAFTGEPLPLATERALPWFNLPLLLGCIVLFSVWAGRRAGAGAGVLLALGMVGTESFYSGFGPHYVDHHGLITAASFGVVLGVIFMGGGWWRAGAPVEGGLLPGSRAAARSAAICSALWGAFGLWFSAASTIPTIALAGGAGLVAVWTLGPAARREGAEFHAGLWRLWGRVGAAGSLGLYLLEYAPAHFGLRMEVNHPFHALAWWGGAELIALLAERRLDGVWGSFWRWAWPLVAVSLTPLTLVLGGADVFLVRDPFVGGVAKSVAEGYSILQIKGMFGWPGFFHYANWNILPLAMAAALLWRRGRRDRGQILLAALVALGVVAMLVVQVRWAMGASGPLLALLLVVLVVMTQGRRARARWLAVLGVAAVSFAPDAISRVRNLRARVAERTPDRVDFQQVLYRDVAAAIRASQPKGDIVVLGSPNASVGVSYYGNFRSIGTLYWENYGGMRAAAEILCAPSADAARTLIREHGITHLALVSEESFLPQYFSILHPGRTPAEFQKTFGWQLLRERRLPLWLRPIPYRVPADAQLPDLRVLLLQVVPDQTESEALWQIAMAQLVGGEIDDAVRSFEAAVMRAPESERVSLCLRAGNTCYGAGVPAAAVRLYRVVLTAGEHSVAMGNLAWILATSQDAALRNGAEALALAQKLSTDDPTSLSALAAALAETGRFAEAVVAAERALALARSSQAGGEAVFAARLEAYRSGKPWRQ